MNLLIQLVHQLSLVRTLRCALQIAHLHYHSESNRELSP